MNVDKEFREGMTTGAYEKLDERLLEIANLKALLKESIEIIEELMPGAKHIVVDVGRLNNFLLKSRDYV